MYWEIQRFEKVGERMVNEWLTHWLLLITEGVKCSSLVCLSFKERCQL